jgi:transposase InsO family protein
MHTVCLMGPRGEVVRIRSVFDDGAMLNAIDAGVFEMVKGRLDELMASLKILRMADGRLVPSLGVWTGEVEVKGLRRGGSFEVFDSGGAWALLFGKPLLTAFDAFHGYGLDEVHIPSDDGAWVTLSNQFFSAGMQVVNEPFIGFTTDIKQRTHLVSEHLGSATTSTSVPDGPLTSTGAPRRTVEERSAWRASQGLPVTKSRGERRLRSWLRHLRAKKGGGVGSEDDDDLGENSAGVAAALGGWGGEPEVHWSSVWVVDEVAEGDYGDPGIEQPMLVKTFEPSILTRQTEPFLPARVDAVMAEVTIGDDLSASEKERVVGVLREFADCFALSMSEVTPVEGAAHKLNIPEGSTFRTKVNQCPLSIPQCEYFNGVIDKMLGAGVIAPISHRDVKSCGATTLAKKAHEGEGLSIEELQHRVNDECIAAGFPSAFEDLPPRPGLHEDGPMDSEAPATKWRVCQDFADLNKVTQVPALPQGDIRAKQQRLSGHRWLNVFDFANGFYACEIREEDQPYICFYVEGRGYFKYLRMPFGLTGAPSTFGEMTARMLGDLVGTLFELFVDDGAMARDSFDELLGDLRVLLTRVREKGLSLSASKSRFFVTEAVFAGARVGPSGIRPDLSKLTAIVDWKTPTDLQNLGAFTGITGYFRTLVKGYSTMAQPLTDLAKGLDVPKGKGKAAYRRAMKGYSLTGLWTREHMHAFLKLKIALTSEPILKGPKFDGTPFIVTTDGCKFGFAGMLTQRHTTVLPNGKEVSRLHPVAFASKRTSAIEERYQPYILEFAALKYSLDKFSDITWGFPIELETDCQALRDQLLSTKMNSTHARWRDGVLSHNIIDVCHRPGRLNAVADGLSRKYVNLPVEDGDGHEWTVSEDWEVRVGLAHDVFGVRGGLGVGAVLKARFAEEKIFLEVIDALLELDYGQSLREKRRARHRAEGYLIEDGRLWRLGDVKSIRAWPRVECVTRAEARDMAWEVHRNGGHFHRDNVKAELLDRICSPGLDRSITQAIIGCGKCKGFGTTHLHSLLEPITRRHPFELLVSDTLTMPLGKGGLKKISLYIDVYSQHVSGNALRKAATGKSTRTALTKVCDTYTDPETLMTDGGPEFDNAEVREFCESRGIKLHIVPAYSPWISGLVEGMNKILLGRLKKLCAPDLGEDEYDVMDVPENWPIHLDEAIRYLNRRILPLLKYSPNELLLGLVVNTPSTPIDVAGGPVTGEDVSLQAVYVNQQRFDGYSQIVENAHRRKEAFDKKVVARAPREVIFRAGQLVQVYRSDLDYTFLAIRKLEPKWSAPRRVISRKKNSYKLKTLEGLPIGGHFSSRRLRRFIPRDGTSLQEAQRAVEEALGLAEEKADVEGEAKGVGMGDEGVMIGVDSEDEPLSEHKGDNGEESGPEEGSVGENGDDSNVNEAKEAEREAEVSEHAEEATAYEAASEIVSEIASEEDDQVVSKREGPRRSKRLLRKFFSRVLKRARS